MASSPGAQPTLRQLELFIAAAHYGSFAAAADIKYVTPNAVSSAVTELESIFNTQLFIRRRAKGLITTTSGHDLVVHAQRLLDQAQELSMLIGNRDDTPRGSVKIGCYATLAATIIPELWAQTTQHLPLITLDIEEGPVEQLSQKLLEGRLDMMISYQIGLPTGVVSDELFHASPHVSLPENHPLANQQSVALKALEHEPLILLDLPPAGDNTLRLLHGQGLHPNVIHRSTSYETVRSMVARGFGYALFFQATHTELSYEGLRIIDLTIDPPLATEPVVLSRDLAARATHRANAVRDLILNMFATALPKPTVQS